MRLQYQWFDQRHNRRRCVTRVGVLFCSWICSAMWTVSAQAQSIGESKAAMVAPSFAAMQQNVAAASVRAPAWNGPRTGPPGARDKTVAIISDDLRNGGILAVAQGIQEAAKVLNWSIKVFDAGGSAAGRSKASVDALASKPDGLILVGTDARVMQPLLMPFTERGIAVVGWHVSPKTGPVANSAVAMNVSTDPLEVARITASAAVVASKGQAGVVIFTDSNFEIAMAKANAMAEVIRACKGCTLLEIRDVAISKNAEQMPAVTRALIAKYGKRWTHALAINDIYFDFAVPELIKAGATGSAISLLSAGDGSAAAFMRIQAKTFQTGTVAEPLNLHGWQLVDELNRRIMQQPVTGYVIPVHMVTTDNIAFDGGPHLQYDPDNGYRDFYRRIWKR